MVGSVTEAQPCVLLRCVGGNAMASRKSSAEVSTASTFWNKTEANGELLLTYLFLFKASFLLLPIFVKYVPLTR